MNTRAPTVRVRDGYIAGAGARITANLNSRSGKWLRTAVKDMAAATVGDWKEWKKSRPS